MLLTTTTVRIERPASGDPYEPAASTSVVAEGISAHIGMPSGSDIDRGGELERIDAVLLAEPGIDLLHTDLIYDEDAGTRYRVAWVAEARGLGLSHTKAGLTRWDGASNG